MSHQSNPRILVVDDWRDTADTLAGLLTLWGYDAEPCYDGVAALEIADIYRPQVVVLDVGMPGVGGFQVALGLRKIPELKTTIIGITGYTGEAVRTCARGAGFDYCFDKPIQMQALRELIGRLTCRPDEFGRHQRGILTAYGGRLLRQMFAG